MFIRAWRDEEYRLSLSDDQRSQLPGNPAGLVAIEDDGLHITGGRFTCCHTDECTLETGLCESICQVFSC